MPNNRAAVVGARGFIGRKTCEIFRANGADVLELGSDNADSLSDPGFWKSAELDSVVWAASRITPALANSNPELVNFELAEFSSFLHAASRSISKIIFASSGGTVYTSGSAPFVETDEALGSNAYGQAKRAMEIALQESSASSVILRIANAYGPGQRIDRGQGVIASWIDSIMKSNSISLFGSAEVVRDFIYVDDVARAIHAATKIEVGNEIINIGSGIGTSLQELMSVLEATTKKQFEVIQIEDRGIDRPAFWLDISRASQIINWAPDVNLHHGIDLTWSEFSK